MKTIIAIIFSIFFFSIIPLSFSVFPYDFGFEKEGLKIDYIRVITGVSASVDFLPPVITCPDKVEISRFDPADPEFTGMATATDDSDQSPTITFTDVVSVVNSINIQRTWTATDDAGNTSDCIQTIYILEYKELEPEPEIKQPDVDYEETPDAKTADEINSVLPPPIVQIRNGIEPGNILCREDLVLIFKSTDNSPACVKLSTAQRLLERGWTEIGHVPQIGTIEVAAPNKVVDVTHLIEANNQFAINFYSQISKENDENIFFSPLSISTAFAIAYEGAKEKTAEEIQEIFGFPANYDARTSEFKTIINNLNPEDISYQLSFANGLWLAERFEPVPEYVETATKYYNSEVATVDFISDDGVDKINAWVEEKTNEKIKDIIPPGSTDDYTRLVITNAIYFKGNWVTQFNENATRDDFFWITPNEEVAVPMMRQDSKLFNYTQTEIMQILKIPYEGDRLSMLVVLPEEKDGLPELEESLTREILRQWNKQLRPTEIHLILPKFKLETEYDLVKHLSYMGMPTPFTERVANFEGIAPIELFISQAVHKAFVDVNEEGTEAAAATALEMVTTSVKPPIPVFKADHPFLFLIQDDSTGNILFIGRVMDPKK